MRDAILHFFIEAGSADSQRRFRIQQELARIDLELAKAKESYQRKKSQLEKRKDSLRISLEHLI